MFIGVVVIVQILLLLVPIALVAYLFRTLGTIVEGLQSINNQTLRIAEAVEQLAATRTAPGVRDPER